MLGIRVGLVDDKMSLTLSGQELFNSKLKATYETMIRTKQREQLDHIVSSLQECDMIYKPELQRQIDVTLRK